METLESVGWVIAGANGAAAKMGLARTTLLAKMKRLSISKRQRFGISNDSAPTAASHITLS
jgi:transcriptional regulator with GAF, ATPase, and Fis domain